jgi:hypothetical protein
VLFINFETFSSPNLKKLGKPSKWKEDKRGKRKHECSGGAV